MANLCDEDRQWDLEMIGRLMRRTPSRILTLHEAAEKKLKDETEQVSKLRAQLWYYNPSNTMSLEPVEIEKREEQVKNLLTSSLGYYAQQAQLIAGNFFLIGDIIVLAEGAFDPRRRVLTWWYMCGVTSAHDTDTDLRVVLIGTSETGQEVSSDNVSLLGIGQIIEKFEDINFTADAVLPYMQ